MKESPSPGAQVDRAVGAGADPLEVVTDLDVAAIASRSGVVRGTPADGVVRTNDRFLEITGLTPIAARGWDWLLSVHGDDRGRLRRAIDAACASGARSAFAIRARHGLGELVDLRVSVTSVAATDGSRVFVASFEPVGEAGPAPDAAEGGDELDPYAILVDAMPYGVAYVAPSGEIDYTNAHWLTATGLAVGDRPAGAASPIARAVATALESASEWSGDVPLGDSSGTLSVVPISDATGGGALLTLTGSAGSPGDATLTDPTSVVTEFARLIDATPDYAAILDSHRRFLHVNPTARRVLGLGADTEVAGMEAGTLLSFRVDDGDGAGEDPYERLRRDKVVMVDGDLRVAGGETVAVTMLVFAITEHAGVPDATLCIARDRTAMREAGERVAASERWFRALVQRSAVLVAVADADYSLTFVSSSSTEFLGFDPEELVGPFPIHLVHPDDQEAFAAAMEQARTAPETVTTTCRVFHRNGEQRLIEASIENLLSDPVINGYVINGRDITETHEHRTARATSEATVDAIVTSAPAAIFVVDAAGDVSTWNPSCEELFGWTADEVVGAAPPFLPEEFVDQRGETYERVARGEMVRARPQLRRRDGRMVTVDLTSAPIFGPEDDMIGVVTVAVDMTQQIEAAEQLEYRADVDRLIASVSRSLVDATADSIGERVMDALRIVAERSGASSASLVVRAETEARASWPADATGDRVVTDGAGAFACARTDGSEHLAGWVVAGQCGPLGTLVLRWPQDPQIELGDLGPLEMLTTALIAALDRVDAELTVRDRELRFRTLVEHSNDVVVVVDATMHLLYVSPAATRALGLTESTVFDPTNSIVHDEDRPGITARMAALIEAGLGATTETFVARFRLADGEFATFELMATNLLDDPVMGGIVINGRDVTGRQAMEQQLRESERRFRGLVQNLAESVTVLGPDGSVKYSSPSASDMMGFEPGHGDGSAALDWVLEPDRERVAEVVARAFVEPGVHGPITLRVQNSNGEIRTLEALGHNRLDDPNVEGVVVTARDITERVTAEEAARRSDARLSALVENLSDVVTIVDTDGNISYTSPAAEKLFGFEEGDSSYTDPISRMHPDDKEDAMERLAQHVAGEHQDPVRFRLRAGDGTWHVVEAVARDMSDDPAVNGVVVTTRDVSDRMRAESLVADQAKVLTRIARGARLHETLTSICDVLERQVPNSMFGVLLLDAESGSTQLGAGPKVAHDLANAIDAVIVDPADPRLRVADVVATAGPAELGSDWRTARVRSVADHLGIASLWSTPIMDSDSLNVIGVIFGCFEVSHAVTPAERDIVEMFAQTAGIAIERRVSEDLLAHRANHDSLTGLPNRVLFLEFLSHALVRSQRNGNSVAVLFLDLDRFKHINDGLGHDAGDVLLRQLSERLRVAMRPSDVVARFGGDEFTVLCDGLDPEVADEQVGEVARRLLDVIERPLSIDGEDRRLSASVGIAIGRSESTAEGLLRDADAAMYEAKQHGKARWEIFDDAMRSAMNARLNLETRLERAIERNEFRLFLQPIVDLASGRCIGGEALLRWHDPELGIITPDQFIGLAEETGLIIPMGEWALAEACRTVASWEEVGLLAPEFTMAVNLSARQVAQADLVERVRAVIARSGPMASRICLEITESVLMEESSVEAMHALKDLGVRLSIDDFGTGYSSLGYLKRFPVDSVKVDRSFVDGLGTDSEDSAIVTAVVSLGHALGLAVVAEGVETSAQLQELLALGCDRAQGYWFSGPRNVTEFAGLLHAQPWLDASASWDQ
ncbi:MAG: PAS domain S-box protein [Acidimicrobiia bacterium]